MVPPCLVINQLRQRIVPADVGDFGVQNLQLRLECTLVEGLDVGRFGVDQLPRPHGRNRQHHARDGIDRRLVRGAVLQRSDASSPRSKVGGALHGRNSIVHHAVFHPVQCMSVCVVPTWCAQLLLLPIPLQPMVLLVLLH